MVYTYTPTYYTSLHDSITSICKNILPFSFKKRRLPAIAVAEQQLSKQQSDNLKWQQDSFHQILNLMGLCKEGIIAEPEVSSFRTHLLETLIASPIDHEPSTILRDKLIFLQELLYAKCISEEEYHASKRPLLQRLAVQGAEIEARDVIVGAQKGISDGEWSVIDLKDDKHTVNSERLTSKHKVKEGSSIKQMKGAASFVSPKKNGKLKEDASDVGCNVVRPIDQKVSTFNFPRNEGGCNNIRPNKNGKLKENVSDVGCNNIRPIDQKVSTFNFPRNELGISMENPFWNSHLNGKENESKSILMMESLPASSVMAEKQSVSDKGKKKPFRILFHREQKEGCGGDCNDNVPDSEGKGKVKSVKKSWGFDGFKKWKKNDSEDETVPLSLSEKSDGASYPGKLVANPVGEGPDTKQIKQILHPNGAPTDFFVDKVLGENIKKELRRIQTELCNKNTNIHLSDDQIEAISTRLPVDKADLKRFFPKSWCDQYGDVVLDVVRKEFKDHVGEMGNSQITVQEKQHNSKRWTTFDDDENSHPNLFAPQEHHYSTKQAGFSSSKNVRASLNSSSIDKGFKYNPFFDV